MFTGFLRKLFVKKKQCDYNIGLRKATQRRIVKERESEEMKNWKPSRDKFFVPADWSNSDNDNANGNSFSQHSVHQQTTESEEKVEMELLAMSRREFLLNKMKEAQSFYLSEDDITEYFKLISLYIDAHAYSAFRHMQERHPVEALSERQEICSQNAINCLFRLEFVQALHETLDLLSDYNKETHLNYNEYVVLKNILTIYNLLKQEQINGEK